MEKDTTERLESNEATVTIKVSCNRAAPIARDDEDSTDEDTPVTVTPLSNDEDPEGEPLKLISVEQPQIGSRTINPDNTVTYTPGSEGQEECNKLAGTYPEFDGYTVTMDYVIEDADDQLRDTATITITVECLRGKPIACEGLTYTTDEDTEIEIEPCGEDPEGSGWAISNCCSWQYGRVYLGILGIPPYIYAPNPTICEENPEMESYTDILGFTITDDDDELSDDGEITVIVKCIRQGPIAEDDYATVPEDGSVDIPVMDNDEDQDNPNDPDAIEFNEITDEPNRGTVTVNDDGTVTYTPEDDVCDKAYGKDTVRDQFKYTVIDVDDNLVSNEATVYITINCERQGPIAVNDYYETDEFTSVVTDPMDNDNDPDGGDIIITILGEPTIGIVEENPDGTVTYTPQPGYCNKFYGDSYTAEFTYTISDYNDDQMTASATVYVKVNCNRRRPIARDDQETTNENVPVTIDTQDNDSDPDGGDIELNEVGQPQLGDGATVTPNPDGTVEYTPGDNCDKIAPATSYTDTFSYTVRDVTDDNLVSNVASVTVTVLCDNRAPIATNDKETTPEDTPVAIPVLDNDSDPEGGPLTVTRIVSHPSDGDVEINEDGTITYTPNPNYCGSTDSFIYEIADEEGARAQARVKVTVTCVNDNPSAVDDYGEVNLGEVDVTIPVLDNDTDPDNGDTLSVVPDSISNGPANGEAVINEDNTITYTPTEGTCGKDTFEYTNSDESGATATATVTIMVECAPPPPKIPPIANYDDAVTDENVPVDIPVLNNDIDEDGPNGIPMVQSIIEYPRNGDVTINDDGTITYRPYPGFCSCTDSFVYQVIDQDGLTDTAHVVVTVNCNNAPVANPDFYGTEQDESVQIYPLDNDYDPEGRDLEVIAIPANGAIDPAEGDLVGNTFYPAYGFCGQVQFEYMIADPSGNTARSSITIDVRCPPPPPCNCDGYKKRYDYTTSETYDEAPGYSAKAAGLDLLEKSSEKGGIMTQSTTYIIIAIITLIFNALAFLMTYICCINKGCKNRKFGFEKGVKVVDNDDNDSDDTLNEDV